MVQSNSEACPTDVVWLYILSLLLYSLYDALGGENVVVDVTIYFIAIFAFFIEMQFLFVKNRFSDVPFFFLLC